MNCIVWPIRSCWISRASWMCLRNWKRCPPRPFLTVCDSGQLRSPWSPPTPTAWSFLWAAGRARRLYAGVLDCLLVALATVVFAAVGYKMLPKMTFSKPLLMTAATLPILLWAVYQYVLMVYGGATAGTRMAKLRLTTFKGNSPSRRQRRHRVIALYFSTASFAMGLLWAFVDVDSLCWHDRISRTYLTDRE